MPRYDFVSEGGAAGNAIQQFLAQREMQRRQQMLDELFQQRQEQDLAFREDEQHVRRTQAETAAARQAQLEAQALEDRQRAAEERAATARQAENVRGVRGMIGEAQTQGPLTPERARTIGIMAYQEGITPPAEVTQLLQPPKPVAAPTPGSFEDYLARSPEDRAVIDQAREAYRLDPRITVNAGGGGGGGRQITPTAESNLVTRLNTQWTKATAPQRDLKQQVTTMRAGLAAGERGDLPQATEAVLQPFLKILDPNSVVREGEFWRLQQGQSALARAQAAVQRLTAGGFVSLPELKKYAQLAEEISTRYDSHIAGERARIGRVAGRYGIPEELVFEGETPTGGAAGGGTVIEWERGPDGKPRRKQ